MRARNEGKATKVQSTAPSGAVRRVRIGDLVRHPDFQVREGTNQDTVAGYAKVITAYRQARQEEEEEQAAQQTTKGTRRRPSLAVSGSFEGFGLDEEAMEALSPFPPITVAMVNGAMVVVDGWHRTAAHEKAGLEEIDAEIVEEVSPEEARWLAGAANMQHGLPLNGKDIRKAFKVFVKARKHVLRDPQGRRYADRFKTYARIAKDFGGGVDKMTIWRWMKQDFPSVARAMGQEPRAGTGGLQGSWRAENAFAKAAMQAIAEAQANLRGVRAPDERGRIITAMDEAAGAMKRAGEWSPVEF